MTRTLWWTLSAVLSLALTSAVQAQCSSSGCPHSPYGSCSAPAPAGEDADATKDDDAAKDEDMAKDEDATPAEPKCTCEDCTCKDGKCECKECTCKDGKCECKNCKCAKCAGAKAGKCDCAKCDCGCEKCKCSKAALKSGCCPNGCCAKGSCCIKILEKVAAQTKESDKAAGESESVHIVLEDLTINYFGAGVKIKKIKISYKGQGLDAGEVAKDLSSIGRAPRCYPAMPCYAPPPPPPTCCVPR